MTSGSSKTDENHEADRAPSKRLDLPSVTSWPIFPFEGDMRVREVAERMPEEKLRKGDPGGEPCECSSDDLKSLSEPIWTDGRWLVRPIRFGSKGAPFPTYMLETVEHLDIHDLDEEYGAELGVLTLRLDRAIMSLEDVGRVHFNRWGDGAYHFHVWFLGRPKGAWQFSGFTLPLWGFTLPPLEADVHAANDALVAASLTAAALDAA